MVLSSLPVAGASSGIIDLLPSPSAATNWTAGLLVDSSEMIFKFDGRQGAKIPDGIVPKNLTDQFTITMWMKHGPSPGMRAEKETILCNSDKTGESPTCCVPHGWTDIAAVGVLSTIGSLGMHSTL